MKGIYLTEEGKKSIEKEIVELEFIFQQVGEKFDSRDSGKYNVYKEILSSATILPVEESWDDFNYHAARKQQSGVIIIQPKS